LSWLPFSFSTLLIAAITLLAEMPGFRSHCFRRHTGWYCHYLFLEDAFSYAIGFHFIDVSMIAAFLRIFSLSRHADTFFDFHYHDIDTVSLFTYAIFSHYFLSMPLR
jgi:hypothetical protein